MRHHNHVCIDGLIIIFQLPEHLIQIIALTRIWPTGISLVAKGNKRRKKHKKGINFFFSIQFIQFSLFFGRTENESNFGGVLQ